MHCALLCIIPRPQLEPPRVSGSGKRMRGWPSCQDVHPGSGGGWPGLLVPRTHPRTRVPTLRLQTGPRSVHSVHTTQAEAAQCLASSHHLHPPASTNRRPALGSRDLCGPIRGLDTICILPVVSASADPWPAQTRPNCMAAARGWALENKQSRERGSWSFYSKEKD